MRLRISLRSGALTNEVGCLRGRLEAWVELTEVTESTLRETLERERQRADRLEAELRDASRSWWRKLFGG